MLDWTYLNCAAIDAAIAVAELIVMWPSDPVGEASRELTRDPGRLLPRLPPRLPPRDPPVVYPLRSPPVFSSSSEPTNSGLLSLLNNISPLARALHSLFTFQLNLLFPSKLPQPPRLAQRLAPTAVTSDGFC